MLKSISLKNFKSLRDFEIDLKPITILLGKNSSGKSSFLQSLLLIKQTIESRDPWTHLVPRGSYVDLGGYRDFVYGNKMRNISIDLALSFPSGILSRQRTKTRRHLDPWMQYYFYKKLDSVFEERIIRISLTYYYSKKKHRTILKELKYLNKHGNPFLVAKNKGEGDFYNVTYFKKIGNRKVGITFRKIRIRKFFEPILPPRSIFWKVNEKLSPLIEVIEGQKYKTYRHKLVMETRFEMEGLISGIGIEMDELAENIIHIDPIREKPKRTYIVTGESKQDVGSRGEATVEMLYTDKGKEQSLSESTRNVKRWLRKLDLAIDFDFPSLRDYAFMFMLKNPSLEINSCIVDHGFGLSQVLPLIVQGFYAPPGRILLLEQPEIHLHPKAQADIAEMLVEISNREITVIVETHSEHIIERLQLLVAKEPSLLDKISILLFQMGKEGTEVSALKLSKEGKRVNWPKNFADGFLNGGLYDAIEQEEIVMREGKKKTKKRKML